MTTPIYSMTDTWTVGGTTYTALGMNVTDTASAAASRLFAFQVGGVDKIIGDKTGLITSVSYATSGSISAAAWTTNGIRSKATAGTLTDTSSSGTVAAAYTNLLGGDTIAASSATTYTDYYNEFISDPVAGSNVTFTNKWSLGLQGRLKCAGIVSSSTIGPATSGGSDLGAYSLGFNNVRARIFDCESGTGTTAVRIDQAQGLSLGTSASMGWTASGTGGAALTTSLFQDASDTLAQRRGTNAQKRRLYNTYTDASNGEWLEESWATNTVTLQTKNNGTGSARAFNLGTNGNTQIVMDSGGGLSLGGTQNTSITNMVVKSFFSWWSNTSAVAILSNAGFSAGARLVFGTAVSTSWACIKPNAAQLQVRLADDSGDAPITVSYIRTVPVTVASLPSAATAGQGSRAFVTDANATTYASVVAGGGSNKVPVYSDGTNWLIG